ncbi:MAG: serine/threonine protein kinase [Lysobacter sp.]|nr:serine/threonine protein kinase [Lysobacter sp.]
METIMELDDFKQAWQTLDARLERQNALNLRLYTDGKLEKARSGLRPLVWGQALQMVFGVLLMLLAGSFWVDHRGVLPLLVSGLIVHAYGLAITVIGGITLGMISRIDYAAPVLGIQKQLARLRSFYIRGGMFAGLSWWVLWVPFLIVLAGHGGDIDGQAWLLSVLYINTGLGVAGLLATWWFHRWSRHPSRPRLAQAMENSLTGESLRKAQRVLDEIERFQQE